MSISDLVFWDADTPIDSLVSRCEHAPVSLTLEEVVQEGAPRAAQGEVWSPQLLPYRSWGAGDATASGAMTAEEAAAFADAAGVDGDLLVVGARGMGISDEERETLLARAATQHGVGGAAAVAVPTAAPDAGLAGAVTVRRDGDGWALTGFDLRRFADAAGSSTHAVVVLPSYVDGAPVVRIAPSAFARRFVQGVGVRVLVVPNAVQRIGSGAFAALPGRHIHLGSGVSSGGDQPCDLASVSPRLERRTYSVGAGNPQYAAYEGSLYSADGTQLLFLAPPYAREVSVPSRVTRVGAAAFCAGCEPPVMVRTGEALAHVGSKEWDDAVWVCPSNAPVRASLAHRGVRLAGPRVTEHDGCWYDFEDEGGTVQAVLVAGPPAPKSASARFASSAAALRAGAAADAARLHRAHAAARAEANDAHGSLSGGTLAPLESGPAAAVVQGPGTVRTSLVLPRAVHGAPLARIAVRALVHAPETVVIPDTVRIIDRENACLGTKRLVLSAGLRSIGERSFRSRTLEGPVPVPVSVRSIGAGCFEYAVVCLEAVGTVVHVPADQLLSCFTEEPTAQGVPFDFARYDEVLCGTKNLPDRLGAVLHRLENPLSLSDATRAALVAQLRAQCTQAQDRVAREGSVALVRALVDAGFIDDSTFDRQIERLRACNRTDCVAYLMEWHRGTAAVQAAPSLRDRFSL